MKFPDSSYSWWRQKLREMKVDEATINEVIITIKDTVNQVVGTESNMSFIVLLALKAVKKQEVKPKAGIAVLPSSEVPKKFKFKRMR